MRLSFFTIALILSFNGCTIEEETTNSSCDFQDNDITYYNYTINDNISFDNEPYGYTQWGLHYDKYFYENNYINKDAHIHGDEVYQNYTGNGVKIAIIDDGFDTEHYELEGRVVKTINYTDEYINTDVSHTYSDDYHGTAVAGIIASNSNGYGIRGVAPNTQLILIKMKESSSDSETIDMFRKAVEAGADIINCSWGTDDVSQSVKDYINCISTNGRDKKGVIVVFASGNTAKNMGNDESAISGVIGVGATNEYNQISSYSNYGKDLDVVAPGGSEYGLGITTLDPMGYDGLMANEYNGYDNYYSFIGTSAAAPIVSGALALVLEKYPDITREEVQYLLKTTSDKIGDEYYDSYGRNDYYGYGKINLNKLIY